MPPKVPLHTQESMTRLEATSRTEKAIAPSAEVSDATLAGVIDAGLDMELDELTLLSRACGPNIGELWALLSPAVDKAG